MPERISPIVVEIEIGSDEDFGSGVGGWFASLPQELGLEVMKFVSQA